MSAPRPRRAGAAFSLVEALVVVSVVALLLGVLAPSLGAGREAARSSACAANARSLQVANLAFAADRGGRFAPGAPGMATPPFNNLLRWHGSRPSQNDPFSPDGGSLTPYLGGKESEQVRSCPSFAPVIDDLAQNGRGFERGCGGYGYNAAFVGADRAPGPVGTWLIADDAAGAPMARFANPAQTIAFADAAIADSVLIEYPFVEPRFWPETPAGAGVRADPTMHFRHGAPRAGRTQASVAWLDGHVSAEARTFTWRSGAYTADPAPLGIGWTGEADSNELFDYD